MVAVARHTLFSSDFFHTPGGGESDNLVESGRDIPHLMDPWFTGDDVVSLRTVDHDKSNVEVDSSSIDREGDVPQCKLLFTTEPNEDRGVAMDMGLINVHLP